MQGLTIEVVPTVAKDDLSHTRWDAADRGDLTGGQSFWSTTVRSLTTVAVHPRGAILLPREASHGVSPLNGEADREDRQT